MIASVLQKLFGLWQGLSDREKRLAKLTAAALVVMAALTVYQRAMARMDDLDQTIVRLEEELVSYTSQIAHRELVESQYAEVAAQHSSAWTEAEIHDRLRQEIYRLASHTPPPLDENGIPVKDPNSEGNLVEGISLGKGNMAEGGKGYREYRINVRIPASPLPNLIEFMERLQKSPQSLRIDAVELNRSPEGDLVGASVDITRIVADGASTRPSEEEEAATSGVGRIALKASEWQAIGAGIKDAPTDTSHGAVEITAEAEDAEAFLIRSLPGGAVYEMIIDLAAAQGEVTLAVGLESEEALFEGARQVTADGGIYRVQVQFTLPGEPGLNVKVKCPVLQMRGKGTVVHVANVLIRKVAEA